MAKRKPKENDKCVRAIRDALTRGYVSRHCQAKIDVRRITTLYLCVFASLIRTSPECPVLRGTQPSGLFSTPYRRTFARTLPCSFFLLPRRPRIL